MPQGMYFGTAEHMQWIQAPDVNVEASKTSWQANSQYLNGGVSLRRATAAHKRYNMSWRLNDQDTLQTILNYSDGVFGPAPYYFLDPFAMNRNLLPQMWAFPAQAGMDALPLIGDEPPTIVPTQSNTLGYPTSSAMYTDFTGVSKSVYIPIPQGYSAYVGVHGSTSGTAGVNIRKHYIADVSAPEDALATMIPVSSPARVEDEPIPGNTFAGITLSIATGATGSLVLSGLSVQILPDGATPELGHFISGQGNGGVDFAKQPQVSQYNATLNRIGISAEFWETHPWQ